MSHRSRKRKPLRIAILILVVLLTTAGGGAGAYFFTQNLYPTLYASQSVCYTLLEKREEATTRTSVMETEAGENSGSTSSSETVASTPVNYSYQDLLGYAEISRDLRDLAGSSGGYARMRSALAETVPAIAGYSDSQMSKTVSFLGTSRVITIQVRYPVAEDAAVIANTAYDVLEEIGEEIYEVTCVYQLQEATVNPAPVTLSYNLIHLGGLAIGFVIGFLIVLVALYFGVVPGVFDKKHKRKKGQKVNEQKLQVDIEQS